jgi:hypothetical protein
MSKARLEQQLAALGLAALVLTVILAALLLSAQTSYAAVSLDPASVPSSWAEPTTSLPAQRSAKAVGVSLQATTVPSISNIIGATYDEARGEIIIFGVADPRFPTMDFSYIRENLVVSLRAFYRQGGPEIPGVSIEGTEDPLTVIYFGGVEDTHFGQVSFETDRLLKAYTMGVDNVTGITVTSQVTGYMSFPERMQLLTETVTDSIVIRYFFTPTLLVEPSLRRIPLSSAAPRSSLTGPTWARRPVRPVPRQPRASWTTSTSTTWTMRRNGGPRTVTRPCTK